MPSVIRTVSRFFVLVSVFLLSADNTVNAESIEAQKKALEAIADFADRICSTIPLKGDDKKLELTGNAKAELNEFLKKVANLGIEGAAKYQASEWQGVLQQDLAGQLNNSRNCKLEVYKDLKDKLLGQSKSSIDKARNTSIAISIKEPAADLARRAAKGVSFHNEAIGIVGEYNRMLQEAKARLPNEQSIQVLRELEYTKHDDQTAAMVATAARKLELIADQLMAGDMESAPPQLSLARQNHQSPQRLKTTYDLNGCWLNNDTKDKHVIKAVSDNIIQQWVYNRHGKPYACLGEKYEIYIDASNHIFSTRLECPEANARKGEGYLEKDDVWLGIRTTGRDGVQKPMQTRFTRLSNPAQCPRP